MSLGEPFCWMRIASLTMRIRVYYCGEVRNTKRVTGVAAVEPEVQVSRPYLTTLLPRLGAY